VEDVRAYRGLSLKFRIEAYPAKFEEDAASLADSQAGVWVMNFTALRFSTSRSARWGENAAQQVRLSVGSLCGFVVWRVLFQYADQKASRCRNGNLASQHDFPGCDLASVDVRIGVIIGTKRGAFQ